MIEGLVTSYPQIESAPAHDAKRHPGHGRRKKCADHTHDYLRADNFGEAVKENDRECPDSKQCNAYRDRLPLVVEPIHQCADRRLCDKPGNSRRRNGYADVSRIPAQRRGEINCEERTDARVHIGHKKIHGVQRVQRPFAGSGFHLLKLKVK